MPPPTSTYQALYTEADASETLTNDSITVKKKSRVRSPKEVTHNMRYREAIMGRKLPRTSDAVYYKAVQEPIASSYKALFQVISRRLLYVKVGERLSTECHRA
jgi:hypothetical protein